MSRKHVALLLATTSRIATSGPRRLTSSWRLAAEVTAYGAARITVRTPAHCPSVSGTCFDDKLELASGRLRYVWQYWLPLPDGKFKFFPDEQIDVELDADVTRGP